MKRKKTIGPFETPRADGVPDPTVPPEEITDPLAAAPPLGKQDESLPFGQEDPFAPMAAGSPFEENDWEKEWFPGDFESELSVFDEFGPLEDSSFEEPMEEDPLGPVEEEEEEWF